MATVTLTIAGQAGATHTAYASSISATGGVATTAWTSKGSRVGDGTLDITLTTGLYVVSVVSTLEGLYSLPSNPLRIAVFSTSYFLSPEEAIRELLINDATVYALIVNRVYPMVAPQNAKAPFIVYNRTTSQHRHNLADASGWGNAIVQVDVYDETYSGVKTLAERVREAVSGYLGTITSDAGSLNAGFITVESEIDLPADFEGGKESLRLKRVSMDVKIWFGETIPTF